VTPPVTRGGRAVWELLPDYVRAADGGDLAAWLDGVGGTVGEVGDLLDALDPDTAPGGVCGLHPSAAPAGWLPALAAVAGVDLAPVPPAQRRDEVVSAFARRTCTVDAIRRAAGWTLTGSRWVRVVPRFGGRWGLRVEVLASECADPDATRAAVLSEKPAGYVLDLVLLVGATYDYLTGTGRTYDTLPGLGATYDDLSRLPPA